VVCILLVMIKRPISCSPGSLMRQIFCMYFISWAIDTDTSKVLNYWGFFGSSVCGPKMTTLLILIELCTYSHFWSEVPCLELLPSKIRYVQFKVVEAGRA